MLFEIKKKNKRGMDTMAFILIGIIVAAIILVAMTGGFSKLINRTKNSLPQESNVGILGSFCDASCLIGSTFDYCYAPRTLVSREGDNPIKIKDATCYYLSRFKPEYNIKPCPKISCSVQFQNNIQSKTEFEKVSCPSELSNYLRIQSLIKSDERNNEYTLYSKLCKPETTNLLFNNEEDTSTNPVVRIPSYCEDQYDKLIKVGDVNSFCIDKIRGYSDDGRLYQDVSCFSFYAGILTNKNINGCLYLVYPITKDSTRYNTLDQYNSFIKNPETFSIRCDTIQDEDTLTSLKKSGKFVAIKEVPGEGSGGSYFTQIESPFKCT